MVAAIMLVMVVQAPKSSMLGKPSKPWWETIKRGDVVTLRPLPGYAFPGIRYWRHDSQKGMIRSDSDAEIFAICAGARDFRTIHVMADDDRIFPLFGPITVQVVKIRRGPPAPIDMAEVISLSNYNAAGRVTDGPVPRPTLPDPYTIPDSFLIPLACLGGDSAPPHSDRGRVPMLVRRSKDTATVRCEDDSCSRIEAISRAEAARAWKEKQERQERLKRKARTDAAQRGAASR